VPMALASKRGTLLFSWRRKTVRHCEYAPFPKHNCENIQAQNGEGVDIWFVCSGDIIKSYPRLVLYKNANDQFFDLSQFLTIAEKDVPVVLYHI